MSSFECGFHSFLGQNRSQFSISFFLFGLLFLVFDLEIVLIFPYAVSGYANGTYGLILVLIFLIILTAGFFFEIGKKALSINSKQTSNVVNPSEKAHILKYDSISTFYYTNRYQNNQYIIKQSFSPKIIKRAYSIRPEDLIPIRVYNNCATYKEEILSENKDKSGVYCFRNLITENL